MVIIDKPILLTANEIIGINFVKYPQLHQCLIWLLFDAYMRYPALIKLKCFQFRMYALTILLYHSPIQSKQVLSSEYNNSIDSRN